MSKKTLKTAIIVDPMGSMVGSRTPEDEIAEHVKDFNELLTPAKLLVYTPYSCYPEDLQLGTDLVLFDYGGMLPGNSMAEKNSWYLVSYAANNPSALVVVVSSFTWGNVIARELEVRDMLGAHNIVPRFWTPTRDEIYADKPQPYDWDPIPKWFRDMHDLPYIDPYVVIPKKLKNPGRRKVSK